MLFTYEGIGNAVTGHETLHFVGRQGTGGLAGVHANLTAEGDVGAPEPGCDLSGAGLILDTFCSPPELRKVKELVSNQPSRFTAWRLFGCSKKKKKKFFFFFFYIFFFQKFRNFGFQFL